MSGQRYGITTTAITWEQAESEISYSDTNTATIRAVGSIGVGGSSTNLADAISAIPSTIPISATGPIGNATQYAGAVATRPSARFLGDDTIQVEVVYETAVPAGQLTNPDDPLGSAADSDLVQRSIVTEEAPLLTHPVVGSFPATDRVRLRALRNGEVVPNSSYDSTGEGTKLYEFIRYNPDDNSIIEVTFSNIPVTVDGITASPLDYARLIASGQEVWRRPVIRHAIEQSRNAPATDDDFGKVGQVVNAPRFAPTLDGGREWFLNGITETTSTGETWKSTFEFEATGEGGALKAVYKGGSKEIT